MKSAATEQLPVVRVSKSLNKYDKVVLSPQKVKEAKEDIARFGLPKIPQTNR